VTINFDGLRRILWIAPFSEASAFPAGTLCRRHADRLAAPRNWELRDTRPRPEFGHSATAGVVAPSRFATPEQHPGPRSARLPLERSAPLPARELEPAPERAPAPAPGRRVAALLPAAANMPHAPLDAPTPLLSRAFRSAR
jgi:hypothetical protein